MKLLAKFDAWQNTEKASVALPEGWYDIEFRFYWLSGRGGAYWGSGGNEGTDNEYGIGYAFAETNLTSNLPRDYLYPEDNGAMSLFRYSDNSAKISGLAASEVAIHSAALCGNVSLGRLVNPDYSVTVFWGKTNGGQISNAWECSSVVLGTEISDPGTFSYPVSGLDADTEYYFTMLLTVNGAQVWAENVSPFRTSPIDEFPKLGVFSCSNLTPVSAMISGILDSLGDSADWCDVSVVLGIAEVSGKTNYLGRFEADLSSFSTNFSLLIPETAYSYQIVAVNSLGYSVASPVSGFITPAESRYNRGTEPGLLQGKIQFATQTDKPMPDYSTRIADLSEEDTDRTLCCFMAQKASDADNTASAAYRTNAVTGKSWKWADYTYFMYEGSIYLKSGVPYYVYSKFDDGGAVFIDDVKVFDQGTVSGYGYTSGTAMPPFGKLGVGVYIPETTGWHDFRSFVWDWTGGKRTVAGVAALQWTTNSAAVQAATPGTTMTNVVENLLSNASYWNEFADPGDGSFLRTGRSLARTLSLDSWTGDGDTVSAELTVEADSNENMLMAYFGADYGGIDTNAWVNSQSFGPIAACETNQAIPVSISVPDGTKYIRFATVFGEDVNWAETIILGGAPKLGESVFASQSDAFTVNIDGTLSSLGAGADSCQVYVKYGIGNDRNLISETKTLNDIGDFRFTLENIVPDTGYTYIVAAINSQGKEDALLVHSFSTIGRAEIAGQVSASANMWTVSFEGLLTTLGDGEHTVVLFVGDSPSSLAAVTNRVVSGVGSLPFTLVMPDFGTYYYAVQVTNVSRGVVWHCSSDTNTIAVKNTASYTWNPAVTNGIWENADNWTVVPADGRLTWPQAVASTASFSGCTAENPVTVTLTASVNCRIKLDDLRGNVTFKSEGEAMLTSAALVNARISGNVTLDGMRADFSASSVELAAGATLKLDNAADVLMRNRLTLQGNSTLLLDHASTNDVGSGYITTTASGAEIRLENGSYFRRSGATDWDVKNSTVRVLSGSVINMNQIFNGDRGRIIVDNATVDAIAGQFFASWGGTNGLVEISGANPKFRYSVIQPREQMPTPIEWIIHVPATGYPDPSTGVVETTTSAVGMGFGSVSSRGPNNRLKITVPYSEEYERLGAGRTVCLVRASGAAPILTNGVVFSEAPTEGSSFFYTFDGKSADESGALEGENVTGIWLRIKGQNCATTIIVR